MRKRFAEAANTPYEPTQYDKLIAPYLRSHRVSGYPYSEESSLEKIMSKRLNPDNTVPEGCNSNNPYPHPKSGFTVQKGFAEAANKPHKPTQYEILIKPYIQNHRVSGHPYSEESSLAKHLKTLRTTKK